MFKYSKKLEEVLDEQEPTDLFVTDNGDSTEDRLIVVIGCSSRSKVEDYAKRTIGSNVVKYDKIITESPDEDLRPSRPTFQDQTRQGDMLEDLWMESQRSGVVSILHVDGVPYAQRGSTNTDMFSRELWVPDVKLNSREEMGSMRALSEEDAYYRGIGLHIFPVIRAHYAVHYIIKL